MKLPKCWTEALIPHAGAPLKLLITHDQIFSGTNVLVPLTEAWAQHLLTRYKELDKNIPNYRRNITGVGFSHPNIPQSIFLNLYRIMGIAISQVSKSLLQENENVFEAMNHRFKDFINLPIQNIQFRNILIPDCIRDEVKVNTKLFKNQASWGSRTATWDKAEREFGTLLTELKYVHQDLFLIQLAEIGRGTSPLFVSNKLEGLIIDRFSGTPRRGDAEEVEAVEINISLEGYQDVSGTESVTAYGCAVFPPDTIVALRALNNQDQATVLDTIKTAIYANTDRLGMINTNLPVATPFGEFAVQISSCDASDANYVDPDDWERSGSVEINSVEVNLDDLRNAL